MKFDRPDLTIDVVLLTLLGDKLHVALMRRENSPEEGKWALPGGYVHVQEDADAEEAALRTLRAKLDFVPKHLEQVFTEANANRDPRGWSASIVYLALHEPTTLTELATDRGLQLFDAEDDGANLPADIAFDHASLVQKAVSRLRAKAAYSTLVAHFLPEQFSLADLLGVYEAVLKIKVNSANFRRKILEQDVLQPTEHLFSSGRPAQGYCLKQELAYFDRGIV